MHPVGGDERARRGWAGGARVDREDPLSRSGQVRLLAGREAVAHRARGTGRRKRGEVADLLAHDVLKVPGLRGPGQPVHAAPAISAARHGSRVDWTAQAGNFQYIVREQVGALATFSSSGPTRPVRDSLPSRQKPDLSAPGKGVFSVYSSTTSPPAPGALIAPDGVHVLFSGTSMSTPMVTGSVALL